MEILAFLFETNPLAINSFFVHLKGDEISSLHQAEH
jgi:hypothetical protein